MDAARTLRAMRGAFVTWATPTLDTFDSDYLTETEKRLAETEAPVPQGGRRRKKEPEPRIVTLADVRKEA
jgi:hypothetical protein